MTSETSDNLETSDNIAQPEVILLNPKQKRFLRGIGHGKKPLVHIGKNGLTEEISQAISECLDTHELIKLKVLDAASCSSKEVALFAVESLAAQHVQTIGHTVMIYRKRKKNPAIRIPKSLS